MRNFVVIISLISFLFVYGCGSDMIWEGKKYETYGILNKDEVKSSNMEYKVIWGNVIWGCLLFESVIGPVYFFGFSIFEPVGPKSFV